MEKMEKSLVMNGVEMESEMNVKDGRNVVWLSKSDLKGKVKILGVEFDNMWQAIDCGIAERKDDERLVLNWMLYVLWQRCGGDVMFWSLMGRIYAKVIVFNWGNKDFGCRNSEMIKQRSEIRKAIEAKYEGKADDASLEAKEKELEWELSNLACGEWSGKNKFGKLLKMCGKAIKQKQAPKIDFAYFDEVGIDWFGKRLQFTKNVAVAKVG